MTEKLCYLITAGDGHVFVFVEKRTIDTRGERVAVLAAAWKTLMSDDQTREWHEPRTGKTRAMLKKLCMSYGEDHVMTQFFLNVSYRQVEDLENATLVPHRQPGNRQAGGNI